MSFVIEKGVAIPPPRSGSGLGAAVEKMEIGDSFFYQSSAHHPDAPLYSAAKNRRPKQFVVRRVEGGARIWRIA